MCAFERSTYASSHTRTCCLMFAQCPYTALRSAGGLAATENRVRLLEYLLTEAAAARINAARGDASCVRSLACSLTLSRGVHTSVANICAGPRPLSVFAPQRGGHSAP
jgi:hypothetical protein